METWAGCNCSRAVKYNEKDYQNKEWMAEYNLKLIEERETKK